MPRPRLVKENEFAYVYFEGKKVSKNEVALKLVGYRNEGHPGANALFDPAELGYACPICGLRNYDTLKWSEYQGFIWCPKCNVDIPSCLCVRSAPPTNKGRPLSKKKAVAYATEIYLDCIGQALARKVPQ